MSKSDKMTWVKESGYIFAMVGSAVGFANILAFSAQCYKNGGGAFLIPFLTANFVIGVPMLLLEGIIGNTYGLPIASAYGKVLPKVWKSCGWISALSCLTIGAFYSVLTSWSVAYTYFASQNLISADTAYFFKHEFLKDSGSLYLFNQISLPIFICTILVSIFTWMIVAKNIGQGVEKICSWFLPLLFIIIIIFSAIVAFLPGASIGFFHYLTPDFSKLKDFNLWRDVFGHVFFSFSLGIGIIVGYSRHTSKKTNLKKAMFMVALGDIFISIISGFAIFGCVGFMSHETGIPFNEIVKSDSTFEMGFIIFPQILQTFSPYMQPIIGGLFFFCVFIAGITGVFSIVESVAGNVEVEFNLSRKNAVSISILLMFFMSIFFCFGNATYIIGALTPMVMGYTFLFGGIAQIIVFMYYDKKINNHKIWLNKDSKIISYYLLKYASLIFLITSLIGALIDEYNKESSINITVRWAWFLVVIIIAFILSQKKPPNLIIPDQTV